MKLTSLLLAVCLASFIGAQTDTLPKGTWKLKAIYGLNGTQTSFVNWNAGGRNNVSVLGFINANADYTKGRIKWGNDLGLALGGLQYINEEAATRAGFQKTDDRIDFATNLGYELKQSIYLSAIGGFRTQMLDGYNYPNDSVRVSNFMAPGYLNFGLGIDYKPNDNFNLFVAPLATKMTFVQDETLANAGAFGVEGAVYDGIGQLVTAGKQFRVEFGSYLKIKYNRTLAKNIDIKTKLELFSNYLDNPGNIDVIGEALFSFKVNSWFSASLQWNLLYDDDIDIRDSKGNVGPRTQFKSVMGLGVSFTMKNYKEEKK
jgi:hypothetical protein